jgi:hypothetical protein
MMTQHLGADFGSAKGFEGAGSGCLFAGAVEPRSADDAVSAAAALKGLSSMDATPSLKGLSSMDADGDAALNGLSSIDVFDDGDSASRGD